MRESARIALAALEGLPEGPHIAEDAPRVVRPPAGIAYRAVESPRGELGMFLVSDGTAKPWRLKVRSPRPLQPPRGARLPQGAAASATSSPSSGSVDVVMGEIDR